MKAKKFTHFSILILSLLTTVHSFSQCLCLNITSFTIAQSGSAINVNWTTAQESINAKDFYLEKSTDAVNWYVIYTVPFGHPGSNTPTNYSYTDNCAKPNSSTTTVYYRLKNSNKDGVITIISLTRSMSVSSWSVGTGCVSCSSLSISGANYICTGGSAVYTIPNTPGAITWSYSPANTALLTVGGTSNTVTVQKSGMDIPITLTATVAGCTSPITKSIILGTPIGSISLLSSYCGGAYVAKNYQLSPTVSGIPYTWSVINNSTGTSSGSSFATSNTGNAVGLYFNQASNYTIKATASNSCGTNTTSFAQSITIPCSNFMASISPNPANSVATLSLTDLTATNRTSTTTAERNKSKTETSADFYDIKIYNIYNILVKSIRVDKATKTLNIDVSKFSDNIYYVKVTKAGQVISTPLVIRRN